MDFSACDLFPFSTRKQWTDLAYRIAYPVLNLMANNRFKEESLMEYSPIWDGRSKNVAYMEAFGRLLAGISPWFNSNIECETESKHQKELFQLALQSCVNAVDPKVPDYLEWGIEPQSLVDAAYLANAFIRSPRLWDNLNLITRNRYIEEFKKLRNIKPFFSNWLLFRAMIEAFLLFIDEKYEVDTIFHILSTINKWYIGDGWYSDGPLFALDYYNSFVIHPMVVEITEICKSHSIITPISFELALNRMQRYNQQLERLISPEATYPVIGRSITYRMGIFQSLALSVWKYSLPPMLTNGQIRYALSSVMERMFNCDDIFTEQGLLNLGFLGHQPEIADYYTNTGSLYMTSLVFLPLGLDFDHDFWTSENKNWTSKKAWTSEYFSKDYKQSILN